MDDNEMLSPAVQDLVIFGLKAQRYAIPVSHIVQIIEMVTITPIPQINPVVAGLINVRGASVPVINMHRYLNQPDSPPQLHTPIILVRVPVAENEQLLGLIVDDVVDVTPALRSTLTHLPDILPDTLHNRPFIQGVLHTSYGMVILLDLTNFFSVVQVTPTTLMEQPAPDLAITAVENHV